MIIKMKLSVNEFKSLVHIKWLERINNDGQLFYTPVDEISTKLFNLDLLRKIISPNLKIKKQSQQFQILIHHNLYICFQTLH